MPLEWFEDVIPAYLPDLTHVRACPPAVAFVRTESFVTPSGACGDRDEPCNDRRGSGLPCDPDAIPIDYASYIRRQNLRDAVELSFAARSLQEAGFRAPAGSDTPPASPAQPLDQEPARSGHPWPRLADAPPPEVEQIHRRVQVTYRVQTLIPAGSRLDVAG